MIDYDDIEKTKPVCQAWELNKPLEGDLKQQFHDLFFGENAWRLRVDDADPKTIFWERLGMDLDNPTLRDAVAVDLAKLDDPSVSNDYISMTPEHLHWSISEHERWLLNRNFRINLVRLENEWSEVQYDDGVVERKRTVERIYQGPRMSRTLLRHFDSIFSEAFENKNGQWQKKNGFDIDSSSIYVPFTNANDFINEIALIPNTHPSLGSASFRSYYDTKWNEYKDRLAEFRISAISTFALVDPDRDKTHTGEWLVKVQRRFGNGTYGYIVAKIDSEGQVKEVRDWWASEENEILSVCEGDFQEGRALSEKPEDAVPFGERVVPMVCSTTSSHYSVFRQRVPDYDLKHVRNYLQFKTRLEGMELMLRILKRNVHLKEVQASECFARETLFISQLFKMLKEKRPLMDLIQQYFDCVGEYDAIFTKLVQLRMARDERLAALNGLVEEYNALSDPELDGDLLVRPDKNLDRKIGLGQTIRTMRLEIDSSLNKDILQLENRLGEIQSRVDDINQKVQRSQEEEGEGIDERELIEALGKMMQEDWSSESQLIEEKAERMSPPIIDSSIYDGILQAAQDSEEEFTTIGNEAELVFQDMTKQNDLAEPEIRSISDSDLPPLATLDFSELHRLMVLSERWKGYMLNMGYELMQMKEMLTMCEDATIKVRRLVHNFKERMERTEEDVWDERHQLRDDFNFKAIAASSLQDIILLHDWYACNAPGKTPEEMGMTEDEFKAFRRRCNDIAYSLRKNQYAQMLAVDRHRLENALQEIQDQMGDAGVLHWKDKYGWEAKKEQEESEFRKEEWSLNDVDSAQVRRMRGMMLSAADEVLKEWEQEKREYVQDSEKMVQRTLDYLKEIGVAENDADLLRLTTANRAAQFKGDVSEEMGKVEAAKRELDSARDRMERQRAALKDIISQTTSAERKALDLENENRGILDLCARERSRLARNRLLLKKIDNETRISELRTTAKAAKSRHLSDFSDLERMRADVDRAQTKYDAAVKDFRRTMGADDKALENLMVGIYNRFQDEILKEGR